MPDLDFAQILGASQNLVPDLRQQAMQDTLFRQQQQDRQLAQQQARTAAARKVQFQQAVHNAVETGDPRSVSRLMIEYPEFADQLKAGMAALSDDAKKRNLTQMGSIYTRAQNGDYAGAAANLKSRIEADKAAGVDTSEDEQVLTALQSGDPAQQKIALGTIGFAIAANDPDKFGETYGKLFPTDKQSAFIREYNDRLAQFGKAAADEWAAVNDAKIGPAGGVVVTGKDLLPGGALSSQPKEGDQTPAANASFTGPAIETVAKSIVPGVNVTSGKRTPAHNKAVGGVEGSYHLTDQARDFTPPPGMTMPMLAAKLKARFGKSFDVINEGDHVHVEPGPSAMRGPQVVQSIQRANALPKGTHYRTPDGREFVR